MLRYFYMSEKENKAVETKIAKSKHAEREERILAFWKEKGIFEKTLEKNKGKGKEFIFYEGPPTANGHPGIHHLEARAFKDAIPRYKTMRGYHVRRKGGWDTHGLPVELQVEKELGLKSKKEIEKYGIGAFNEKCKESVWKYVHEWEDFTNRMGYWVDLKNPYVTYKPKYIESIWNIIATADKQDLLYKDYKVVPWCPRCGTGLSSHELAQGYQDVKDLSVYVKFKVKNPEKIGLTGDVFILVWTTTPWTLPGNVALAVGEKIEYVSVKCKVQNVGEQILIVAKERLESLKSKGEIDEVVGASWKGKELVGLEYEPLYLSVVDNVSGGEKEKLANAFKVYSADFVTTSDGTGIVHIAPMYGQDDFALGTENNLPKYHLVSDDGTFKKEAGELAGLFVKDQNTDVAIIKDLAGRGLLFAKEKVEHSYPHCWRCKTPLIYFARDSWYIRMSSLRDKMVKGNEGIHWEPEHIKDGRFGEWLREVKDWAISRERYWGTPLPIWICNNTKCAKKKVVGSAKELSKEPNNKYSLIRHGEGENNATHVISSDHAFPHHLTPNGRTQVEEASKELKKKKIDLAFVSPFVRTRETFEILNKELGLNKDQIIFDDRIGELKTGVWNGRNANDFVTEFKHEDRFDRCPEGGETYVDVKKRVGEFLYEMENKYQGKNILIVSHETPIFLSVAVAEGLDRKQALELRGNREFIANADIIELDFKVVPHNSEYELDLHRPNIDDVTFSCSCGGKMQRVKEVMDVWFDSGAMPFAQDHYPFENKEYIEKNGFPADFISEAIDQTRGWFYTLHAIGALMGMGKAYKNVICLGHILDKEGKKMSKSVGNIVNPWDVMDKYGADAARFWMYSVNQPGDSKNFDEKTVDEVVKKVFNLASNVLSFYQMYKGDSFDEGKIKKSENILDLWIISRLNAVIDEVTKNLEAYKFFESSRTIKDFIADLSQWYLRRSRDRFKSEGGDKVEALHTLRHVLLELAKIMAPFTPFFAEELYKEVGGKLESVHLETWPEAGKVDEKLVETMEAVRSISSKGLEARMNAKINVRQPLAKLLIKDGTLSKDVEALQIIKDEVNVKQITFDKNLMTEVDLDLKITPELKEEGMVRELIRAIQDLRKASALTVKDKAVLTVDTNDIGKALIDKNESEISTATSLGDIKLEQLSGEGIDIDGIMFKLEIRK
jgi:isoleucyl-tRNA synthetase